MNGVKTTFGNGGMRLDTVGEYMLIFRRILPVSRCDNRNWNRIVAIANFQAQIWQYTGPFGFGDLDMLGMHILKVQLKNRGWKW